MIADSTLSTTLKTGSLTTGRWLAENIAKNSKKLVKKLTGKSLKTSLFILKSEFFEGWFWGQYAFLS